MTNQEDRPLNAEELDIVAGGQGMEAVFQYGGLTLFVYAEPTFYGVGVTNKDTGERFGKATFPGLC